MLNGGFIILQKYPFNSWVELWVNKSKTSGKLISFFKTLFLHLAFLSNSWISRGEWQLYPTVFIWGPVIWRGSLTITWEFAASVKKEIKRNKSWIIDKIPNFWPKQKQKLFLLLLLAVAENSVGSSGFGIIFYRVCGCGIIKTKISRVSIKRCYLNTFIAYHDSTSR